MKKIYTFLSIFLFVANFTKAQVVYTGKPMYNIDVKRGGIYLGSIKVELFPAIAYHHTRNFDSLVSMQFYDSTAFHRVIPGFMIQGGDPNSRHGATSTWGFGQPSQPNVNAEFSAAKHLRGILSAARSTNINSATSQFFICVAAAPNLNGQYSVYGRVIGGMNYADSIVLAPRNSNDLPNVKHEMHITYIGSNDTLPLKPTLNSPPDNSLSVSINIAPLLKWNAVPVGIIYTLEVADDSSFTSIIKTLETGNLSAYVNSGLLPGTKYYWRVKANNGGHVSDWSDVWTFETFIDLVGIKQKQEASKFTVFPNPSSGKFVFENAQLGDQLEVLDVTGKLIYTNTFKETSHEINLEGKDKGVYSYKLISEKETFQGKIIVK
ncbi:peptidylprolyl isomerase [Aurantibacillus circumpalustris]|uniref:peptidylprolyl isomerase n=1 Tax=Aurantibacillus circumpalustris TaxID=3036359 RepID=UPI00295A9CBF|nr:peptidylprolyl isomerase [Aurantibacillus circumpalustris]